MNLAQDLGTRTCPECGSNRLYVGRDAYRCERCETVKDLRVLADSSILTDYFRQAVISAAQIITKDAKKPEPKTPYYELHNQIYTPKAATNLPSRGLQVCCWCNRTRDEHGVSNRCADRSGRLFVPLLLADLPVYAR